MRGSYLARHTSELFECFTRHHRIGKKYEQHPKAFDQSWGALPSSVTVGVAHAPAAAVHVATQDRTLEQVGVMI